MFVAMNGRKVEKRRTRRPPTGTMPLPNCGLDRAAFSALDAPSAHDLPRFPTADEAKIQ
jgi:hypothetical protein